MKTIQIKNLPIELYKFLKFCGFAESGGQAKHLVTEGLVQVNNKIEKQKGLKLKAEDIVTFAGKTVQVIGPPL